MDVLRLWDMDWDLGSLGSEFFFGFAPLVRGRSGGNVGWFTWTTRLSIIGTIEIELVRNAGCMDALRLCNEDWYLIFLSLTYPLQHFHPPLQQSSLGPLHQQCHPLILFNPFPKFQSNLPVLGNAFFASCSTYRALDQVLTHMRP